jgi:hypothetical protein
VKEFYLEDEKSEIYFLILPSVYPKEILKLAL